MNDMSEPMTQDVPYPDDGVHCGGCGGTKGIHYPPCDGKTFPYKITQMSGPTEPRIEIRETFMRPTPEWPEGGYMREVGGKVEMATGYFATIHPDKPSPYLGGKPPVMVLWDRGDWPW